MAGFAGNTLGNVRTVIERDMIRELMDPYPFNGFVLIIMGLELLDPWTVRLHDPVTVHANIERGDRRMPGFFNPDMAIPAIDLVNARMQPMTKRNRLFGSVPLIRRARKYGVGNRACDR